MTLGTIARTLAKAAGIVVFAASFVLARNVVADQLGLRPAAFNDRIARITADEPFRSGIAAMRRHLPVEAIRVIPTGHEPGMRDVTDAEVEVREVGFF